MKVSRLFFPSHLALGLSAFLALPKEGRAEPVLNLDPPPWVGQRNGTIYMKDAQDYLRLMPHGYLALRHQSFKAGRNDLSEAQAGVDLTSRLLIRQAQVGVSGEVVRRFLFDVSLNILSNRAIDGTRVNPSGETRVALLHSWLVLDAVKGARLKLGLQPTPFSQENQTDLTDLAFLERNIAIRGFAVPSPTALGAAFQGTSPHGRAFWNVGFFGAEALNPTSLERGTDTIGRVGGALWRSVNPCLGSLSLGLSARYGHRDVKNERGPAPAVVSNQGFAVWSPTTSTGALLRSAGTQWAAGADFQWTHSWVRTRGEAYWVSRGLRQVTPLAMTSAVVKDNLEGLAWSAEVSVWPLYAKRMIGGRVPLMGNNAEPRRLQIAEIEPLVDRYGLELAFMAAGIDAKLRGENKPLRVNQFSAVANYWHTRHVKLSISYVSYHTPSADGQNLALVPANLAPTTDGTKRSFGELAAQVTLIL